MIYKILRYEEPTQKFVKNGGQRFYENGDNLLNSNILFLFCKHVILYENKWHQPKMCKLFCLNQTYFSQIGIRENY